MALLDAIPMNGDQLVNSNVPEFSATATASTTSPSAKLL